MEALDALGINGLFLVSQIVNFFILFIMLRVLLWKPLLQRIDERRTMLEKEKDDAAALEEARANIADERALSLEEVREEAKSIVAQARQQAKTLADQAAEEASQKTDKIVEAARQAAEEERNRILGQARGQIAVLAMAAAQKIIAEELDEQRQQALVASFFSGIHDGKVEVVPADFETIS
ncbi:MAG: F0F1 ATP synthase subunit B, partial [Chloroflexota bacterium]|nr:F0F1 ATP synthase subunit B [Chloroflexota bacterium]